MDEDLFDLEPEPPRRGGGKAGGGGRGRGRGGAGGAPPTPDAPLADRMRPRTLDEVVGQEDLVGPDGALRRLLEADELPSLLLWGPPGSGKTTLARLVAAHTSARFLEYSAVSVGSREVKAVMAEAQKLRRAGGARTILFLDEIHRFNKAQQDALLPWVERGDVTLIGATTENPSFEVNPALISRTRLFVLKPLRREHVRALLVRALADERGLAGRGPALTADALDALADLSEGDARAALNFIEQIAAVARAGGGPEAVDANDLPALLQRAVRYDKSGEEHYNLISALHKSLRNSDAQASLYWLGRMLEGGEDPLYIARRLVRFASEDVGLADPGALPQAMAARDAVHFIGLPEGELALAQATLYLALSPKSNALYTAWSKVRQETGRGVNPPVPLHLRNAPTRLMGGLGYGKGYVYAPGTEAEIADMECLPPALAGRVFYDPRGRGHEAELRRRLEQILEWRRRRAERPPPERKGGP